MMNDSQGRQSLLCSKQPSVVAPAFPVTAHHQLRDSLLICPREAGVLNYVVRGGIAEQDIRDPEAPVRIVSNLSFTPTSLSSLTFGSGTLIAAGGLDSQIYLSYHVPLGSPESPDESGRSRVEWESEYLDIPGLINNSISLTSIDLTFSNESSAEPRLLVSNNDQTMRLYDIPLHDSSHPRPHEVGRIYFPVPVNYSSISPDGRTLISVGDSHDIYLHQITGGAQLSFQKIKTLEMPRSDATPLLYAPASYTSLSIPVFSSSCRPVYSPWAYPNADFISRPLQYGAQEACFSVAFNNDGSKFAVASQQGAVAVWDVKNTSTPLRVFHTGKMRSMGRGGRINDETGAASGWLTDPWAWIFDHGGFGPMRTPEWSVRSVKFSKSEGGREIMAFTEHTSVVHVIDALTFEEHEMLRMPALRRELALQTAPPTHDSYKYFEDLDLAGMCFDPSGEKMYVAGAGYGFPSVLDTPAIGAGGGIIHVGAVAEWTMRTEDMSAAV